MTISIKDKSSGKIKKITGEFKKLDSASRKAGDGAKAAGGGLSAMNPKLLVAGAAIAGVVIALKKLSQAFGDVVKTAADFETKMAELSTLYAGETDAFIQEATEHVYELGRAWSTTHAEFQKIMYDTKSAQLGHTADELRLVAEQVNALALAAQGGPVESLEALTYTMKAYGVEADHAGWVTQKFLHTVNEGKTTLEQLVQPISNVASQAAITGVNIDSMFASFAAGSQFGSLDIYSTQFRAFLRSLTNPQGELVNALEALGINDIKRYLAENNGNYMVLLDELVQYANDNGLYVEELFQEIRAKNFVMKTQTQAFAESYEKYYAGLNDETKVYIEAVMKMRDTTNEAIGRTKNLFDEIKVRIGNVILPFLVFIMEFFMAVADEFTKLFGVADEGAKKMEHDFEGLRDALYIFVGGILAAITTIRVLVQVVQGVIGALGWTFLGIVEIIAKGINALISGAETVENAIRSITGQKKVEWNFDVEGIAEARKQMGKLTTDADKGIREAFSDAGQWGAALKRARDKAGSVKTADELFDMSTFEEPDSLTTPALIDEDKRAEAKKKTEKSAKTLGDPNLFLNTLMHTNTLIGVSNSLLSSIDMSLKRKAGMGDSSFNYQEGVPNL